MLLLETKSYLSSEICELFYLRKYVVVSVSAGCFHMHLKINANDSFDGDFETNFDYFLIVRG